MPVEIKELVIRAIAQGAAPGSSKGCGPCGDGGGGSSGGGGDSEGAVSDAAIDRTVQAVLRILRSKRER